MIAIALALLPLTGIAQDAWAQLWSELDRLHEANLPRAESEFLRTHLSTAAEAAVGDPRADLLRAELEHLAGHDVSVLAERLAGLPSDAFTPRECWFLADVLPSGQTRVNVLLQALEPLSELQHWQVLLAYKTYADEARTLQLQGSTIVLQQRLYARYPSAGIAQDLALSLKAVGDHDAADGVLAEAIARETGAGRRPKDLWESRGILALGFGDEPRARDYLGKALALGSDDAGLLLARLDLMSGSTEAARRGFRALLVNQPPPDWAWRGWGTTLLPIARAQPATKSNPPSQR